MSTAIFDGQYPDGWDDYVGQERAKRKLRTMAMSAARRGKPMRHVLIHSPYPGVGKTALALQVAKELGNPTHPVSGAVKLTEARVLFSRIEAGDTIYYDEFHKVMDSGKKNAEWLLHWLENGMLLTPFGEEKTPPATLIASTTDLGSIPAPILSRFAVISLDQYTPDEGAQIAKVMGAKVLAGENLPNVSFSCADKVAAAASNQPRLMREILMSLRDLVTIEAIDSPTSGDYDLSEALELCELTQDGLTQDAQHYLTIMFTEMRGAPAGSNLLKERLGLVGAGLAMVEQLLLDKDLIIKTGQGRILTGAGLRRAQQLVGELDA